MNLPMLAVSVTGLRKIKGQIPTKAMVFCILADHSVKDLEIDLALRKQSVLSEDCT